MLSQKLRIFLVHSGVNSAMDINQQVYFWAHMLDEAFGKKVITEGKHWPVDYAKTAFNAIKSSLLGQQSWYSDDYIKADVQTFINEFAPLSHKNSNLGFFMTIVKWFIEYSGTSRQKYQEFIERKLDGIIGALQTVLNDPSYDKIKNEIKTKWTLQQFEQLQQKISDEAKASSDEKLKSIVKRDDYDVMPIYSYEELHEKFGGSQTGYKGESEWCHANGKSTYDSWTKNGTQMFFVLAKKDWQKVLQPEYKPIEKDYNAYDEYGLSLIAILVDVATGNLLNETLRWNHVIDPSYTNPGASVDKAFKNNWGALSQVVGLDVEQICKNECKYMAKKLQDKVENANREVAEILADVDKIDEYIIPKKLKHLVTKVDIPENVTSIGNWAFYECFNLTSVTIPDSVTSIGYGAFSWCSKLTNMTIGNSVTSIGNSAFEYCSGLMSVTIPDSVASIGPYAFSNCSSLASVHISDLAKWCGILFSSYDSNPLCHAHNLYLNGEKITDLAIPNSVTSIEDYAFFTCHGLTSVMIPDNVTSIGKYAFDGCNRLMSVTIGNGRTRIWPWAFYNCTNLKEIIFKGKTIDEVKAMKDYPWGIKDKSAIRYER